jgi:hypothetical protein
MARNKQLIHRTAIIVPTLGNRPEYLEECVQSIINAGDCLVVIVAPMETIFSNFVRSNVNLFVEDPGMGLASAINYAVSKLPSEVMYFNWLGDDDLLVKGSLEACTSLLATRNGVSAVYGQCEYIDQNSRKFGVNFSSIWASKILKFGPDLIPQPGALFRLDAFRAIGGLNTQYKLAFDFDLFINLKTQGELQYVPQLLGKFRWHSDSLSVGSRLASVKEASQVRKSHLPIYLRAISLLWEFPIVAATFLAGVFLSARLRKTR